MGTCASNSSSGFRFVNSFEELDLLNAMNFLKFAQHNYFAGWKTQETNGPMSTRICVESLLSENGLVTWKGHVELDGALEDILPFINFKASLDSNDKFKNEERESYFREVFLFQNYPVSPSNSISQASEPMVTVREETSHEMELSNSPRPREMVFKLQTVKIQAPKKIVVCLAQSSSFVFPKPKSNVLRSHDFYHLVKCDVHEYGWVLEEIQVNGSVKVKLTFLCGVDPKFSEWETKFADEELISRFWGKLRVEDFLTKALKVFESSFHSYLLKFYHFASAGVGELDWIDVDKSQHLELQQGTSVKHKKYGHGIVRSFDMQGRVCVTYDSGQVIDHLPSDKKNLKTSVLIGTRVKHKTMGVGTVAQFDEMGRIYVKFDNDETHRYHDGNWKKQMTVLNSYAMTDFGPPRIQWRPSPQLVREGMSRVRFLIDATTDEVLAYLLERDTDKSTVGDNTSAFHSQSSKGNCNCHEIEQYDERKVLKEVSDHSRLIYEKRRMTPPLNPRDFVYIESWEEIAPQTFVIVHETYEYDVLQEAQSVRGETHLTGWLLEPSLEDKYVCQATFQLCIDPKGFIAPDAVNALRTSMILEKVTNMRAYFRERSQSKKSLKFFAGMSFTTTISDAFSSPRGRKEEDHCCS